MGATFPQHSHAVAGPAARPGRQVRGLKSASGFSSQARSGGRAGPRAPSGGRAPIDTGTGREPAGPDPQPPDCTEPPEPPDRLDRCEWSPDGRGAPAPDTAVSARSP
jgi:hypothetical protein